ncbi:hypothetical protein Hanom_Chr14g01331151 [Helianthus anomalus]
MCHPQLNPFIRDLQLQCPPFNTITTKHYRTPPPLPFSCRSTPPTTALLPVVVLHH